MRFVHFAIPVTLCWLSSDAEAHSGGTNAEGSHNNRKTGDYHCHGGRSAPPLKRALTRSEPLRAFGNEFAYFANCAAARAAGIAPLRRGDLGYRPGLALPMRLTV